MEIDETLARHIADVQRGLLAVDLDPSRVQALLADIGALVHADAAMGAWLNEGQPWLTTWRAGPQIAAYMAETFAGVDREGNIRTHDPDLDRVNRTRRGLGTGIYHEREFAHRDRIVAARYHREGFGPAGMHHVIGMTARLSVGEAVFAFGYDDGDGLAREEDRIKAVLALLLPAFEQGFQGLDRRSRHRERLEKAMAEADLPARIVAGDAPPPADALLHLPLPELTTGEAPTPYLAVSGPDVEHLAARLAACFDLTERQTATARLLLAGRSTAEIAADLGIRLNTARRHCEAVLDKTGAGQRHRLAVIAARQGRCGPNGCAT
ncbi:helix-turn-helix transcriptional regulator [Roseospira navarrensis]|nr:helix-turn-helix transcriptional regulator [Roseospira navarrensis]